MTIKIFWRNLKKHGVSVPFLLFLSQNFPENPQFWRKNDHFSKKCTHVCSREIETRNSECEKSNFFFIKKNTRFRTGKHTFANFFSRKNFVFFTFQHKTLDFVFLKSAKPGYYIDSSPTFIFYKIAGKKKLFFFLKSLVLCQNSLGKKRKENWPPPAQQGSHRGYKFLCKKNVFFFGPLFLLLKIASKMKKKFSRERKIRSVNFHVM